MRQLDSNTVIAVAALVTSVVAVWVAWDESRVQRASQRASFMPILQVEVGLQGTTNEYAAAATLRVANAGTGVAFIESAALSVGEARVTDYQTLASALFTPRLASLADLSWETLRGYIQPQQTKEALTFRWPITQETLSLFEAYRDNVLVDRLAGFSLRLCYCSLFGECWRSSSDSTSRPQPVRACASDEDAIESIWQTYYRTRGETAATAAGAGQVQRPQGATPSVPAGPRLPPIAPGPDGGE